MNDAQIEKAAKIVKICYLARQPGMDSVAIKLNAGPTYQEIQAAKAWAIAFELAAREDSVWQLVSEYRERTR